MELSKVTSAGSEDLYCLDVELYGSPQYGAVYILDAERPAVVDSGTGRNYEWILEALAELDIAPEELEVIAPTHVHLDHAGGVGYLAEACPNADVYVYESGAQFLVDPTQIWAGTKEVVGDRIEYYAEPRPVDEDRIVELDDGDTVDLGDHALDVHHAPGHAFHQAVFYDPANDGVFTADAAGINVPNRPGVRQTSPPPGFDLEGCLADVEMLDDLDPGALYYGHFGGSETDGLLAEYATVIQEWVDRVEAKRNELDDDEAVVEYFAEQVETDSPWSAQHARGEERMNTRGVLHYLDNRE
ncbi:MBL fold metallo-hydrolase [Halovenus sp. WSH3]|uniref:MBL fold metallo-hydrolase n=1 Tax=Halovenus carboxidivorans TaxID=2692199 RepID=A0A6B0SZC1_9EURY|nr:MBL fold metallo-hydrolase [Halovenus carboxidivorans]MXR51014.1 MBL fold metallo-hydrolase [Halovenus carboxidivorans]